MQSDSDNDFVRYAGRVLFPRGPQDLTSTANCPACFAWLTGPVCHKCGLDLGHSAAAELFTRSMDAAAALDRRVALIGRMRYETAHPIPGAEIASPSEPTATTPVLASPVVTAPPVTLPVVTLPVVTPPVVTPPPVVPRPSSVPQLDDILRPPATPAETSSSDRPTAPRRSSVQVILLIVGVSLLSIAAIFFLVYAFITYGLIVRSIIIGSITVAAIVAASLLSRRGLRSTAEGIAAFAVVLIYLDAFAARANDMLQLASVDGASFWGTTLIASTIALTLWHRTSGLRVPSVIAFAALSPGLGLLVYGLADSLPIETRLFATFAAAAIGGLAAPLAAGRSSSGAASAGPASADAASVHSTGWRHPDAAISPVEGDYPTVVPVEREATGQDGRPAGLAERVILLSLAALGLLTAFFTAFIVGPEETWAPVVSLIIVAVIALALAGIGCRTTDARPIDTETGVGFRLAFAGLGSVALAATGVAAAIRIGTLEAAVLWPSLVAVFVALALETYSLRPTLASPVRRTARVATFSAAGVAALALVLPLGTALVTAIGLAVTPIGRQWRWYATDATAASIADVGRAIIVLLAVTILAAAFWAASGRLSKRRALLAWAGMTIALLAVPLLGSVWATVAGWFVVATLGLAALIRRPHAALPLRLPVIVGVIAGAVLGYSVSWFSIDTWGWASIATCALLVAARWSVPGRVPDAQLPGAQLPGVQPPHPQLLRAVFLGGASIVGLASAATLARQLAEVNDFGPAVRIDAFHFVGILATVLLLAAALAPARWASRLDRRLVLWIALVAAGIGSIGSATGLAALPSSASPRPLLPEFGTSLVLGILLFGALAVWAVGRAQATMRIERIAASIAIAPTVYWVVDSFARVLQLPETVRSISPIVAALLVSVGALALTVLRPSSSPRWLRELGVALVGIPAVITTVIDRSETTWLALLLAGVTALVLAVSEDGLFSARSSRKQLGWLALALATAGLWWRLGGSGVTALEPYVLPVAAVLLIVAWMIWRSADRRQRAAVSGAAGQGAAGPLTTEERSAGQGSQEPDVAPSAAAPWIALGGLLVAILPLSANAVSGSLVRAIVIGLVSAALLLVGSLLVAKPRFRGWLDAAALAGAVGVLVTSVGRATSLALEPGGNRDLRLDGWLAATFVVLVVAAVGVARQGVAGHDAASPSGETATLRLTASRVLVVVAMTAVFVLEAVSLRSETVGSARAIVVVVVFAALHLVGVLGRRAPFTLSTGWVALGYSAVTAIIGIAVGALDPIEVGTVPVAAALLVGGSIQLAKTPAARSWPFLGPGVLVLLLPSLLATAGDRPLWRLVGLGVVAVAVLVIGVVRRLQAPFIIGAVVVLVHGIATFSSEIRVVYEAVPWWLWLGVGGVLLIVLAARYERRIQNLKDAVLRVGALR